MNRDYAVRAVRCDYQASDDEVYEKLCAATDPLVRSWDKLERAKTIALKVNMSKPLADIAWFEGRRRELVDEAVFRAVLRRLRERTNAKIYAVDGLFERPDGRPLHALNYCNILKEFDIDFVDAHQPPFTLYESPAGGVMFRRYMLSAAIGSADAFVSIAKMKNHAFQGVTLTLKNLFGLPPMMPYGRTRSYWHHIIRLSHVLPDLGRIANPCLNIVDGLTSQSGREWGGTGLITNLLMAGDHPIATDACGTSLMGHAPDIDWPHQPFLRDRSALKIAAEHGFGTVNLDEIDFQSEVEGPVGEFLTQALDSVETVARWRETTCEQALYFRDNRDQFISKYAGEYIMLQDGNVIWHGPDASVLRSRRDLSGPKKDSAIYLKLMDPDEVEGEKFEVYERELAKMRAER